MIIIRPQLLVNGSNKHQPFAFPVSSTPKHRSGFSLDPAHTTEPNSCNLLERTHVVHMMLMKQVCKLDNVLVWYPFCPSPLFVKISWTIQFTSSI